MITDIIVMKGDFIKHDPVDPDIPFNLKYGVWGCPKRHAMNFIKPILSEYYKYDFITGTYEIVTTTVSKQYYRPIEFYDHVLTPNEINKLTPSEILKYIKYFMDNNCLFQVDLYTSFLLSENKNILRTIQSKISSSGYRIMTDTELGNIYIKRNEIFDETWNTLFYYHLLPPRQKLHFLNIKTCKCNCQQFKREGNCSHTGKIMLHHVVNKYLYALVDIYKIIAHYL